MLIPKDTGNWYSIIEGAVLHQLDVDIPAVLLDGLMNVAHIDGLDVHCAEVA